MIQEADRESNKLCNSSVVVGSYGLYQNSFGVIPRLPLNMMSELRCSQ